VNRAEHQRLERIDVEDEKMEDGEADAQRREQHGLPAPHLALIAGELLVGHRRLDDFVDARCGHEKTALRCAQRGVLSGRRLAICRRGLPAR
jgi:hypothetical protein